LGNAIISERGSVSRSTPPLPIKRLRVTDLRSVFKSGHDQSWHCFVISALVFYLGRPAEPAAAFF
jgi:hypothetical protein